MGLRKTTLTLMAMTLAMSLAGCGGDDASASGGAPPKDETADRVAVIVKGKATADDVAKGKYTPTDFAIATIQATCATKPAEPSKQIYAERWLDQAGYQKGVFLRDYNVSHFVVTAGQYVGDWQNELGRRNGRDPDTDENSSHWDELCEIKDPVGSFLKWLPTRKPD